MFIREHCLNVLVFILNVFKMKEHKIHHLKLLINVELFKLN